LYASRLGRFGLQVWGDKGWRVTSQAGVRYRGIATNFGDLSPIYCASQINVDIGRLHQLDIVTMRNFDILACGGFVLAERSEDLETLFELDKEIACYSTLEELEQKVAHYLAHPETAREIAMAGRRAVLERHTIALRVGHMLERINGPG
jgi:spore maturation protein CgeB